MAIHKFKRNNDFNYINKDTIPTGCSGRCPSMTNGNNNLKRAEGNNAPSMTKENNDICVSIPCHSRAQTRESRNMDFSSAGYSCQSTNMTNEDNAPSITKGNNALRMISQSGRSLLGVLGTERMDVIQLLPV